MTPSSLSNLLLLAAWTLLSLLIVSRTTTHALISPEPVSALLQKHASTIANLKSAATAASVDLSQLPYSNDVFFLRYCLLEQEDPLPALQQSLEWRTSKQGQSICTRAAAAVTQATEGGGSWNNEAVLSAAPHADSIREFITPVNCITTTASTGDLVYCIRAGAIDDTALMKAVSVDQMVDFFLYTKEVNALVADMRSSPSLLSVVTCNDLSNVKLIGGSADFRQALSASSNTASTVYPNTAGPTLLLNLPRLLSALVKLFTPLFPERVKERLKFQQGPLQSVQDLRDVASSSASPARTEFVRQLDEILYSS